METNKIDNGRKSQNNKIKILERNEIKLRR